MADTGRTRKRSPFAYPPLKEIRLCYAVVVGTIGYAWWCVFQISQQYKFQIGDLGSVVRLPIVGERFKDESNWEWFRWSPMAYSALPLYFLSSLFFNIGSSFLPETLFVSLYTLLSIAICSYQFTPILVFYVILQGTFIFIAQSLSPRRTTVWLASLPILYFVMNQTDHLHSDVFLVLLFVSYTLLSFISFALETVNGPLRPEESSLAKRYLRMMFYSFYHPYLVSLIVLYPDFERQISKRKKRARDWSSTLLFGLRVGFWWGVCELVLHFCYFESILRNLHYSASLPKDTFVALGMALGQFFHVKYVVIFGLPSFFAKLDNMQPLDGPMCMARVCLYSKVWRSFDRGLYNFFKKYIFIPICEPSFSLPRKIIGVFISYGFVLIWHGFYKHNIVWILLNISALFMEMTSKAIYSIDGVREWREKRMSDVNLRRFLGLLQIIPFAFGLYSNFYFLGGAELGGLYVDRVLVEETLPVRPFFLVLITLGYFYTQTCMEVERLMELKELSAENTKKTKKVE